MYKFQQYYEVDILKMFHFRTQRTVIYVSSILLWKARSVRFRDCQANCHQLVVGVIRTERESSKQQEQSCGTWVCCTAFSTPPM